MKNKEADQIYVDNRFTRKNEEYSELELNELKKKIIDEIPDINFELIHEKVNYLENITIRGHHFRDLIFQFFLNYPSYIEFLEKKRDISYDIKEELLSSIKDSFIGMINNEESFLYLVDVYGYEGKGTEKVFFAFNLLILSIFLMSEDKIVFLTTSKDYICHECYQGEHCEPKSIYKQKKDYLEEMHEIKKILNILALKNINDRISISQLRNAVILLYSQYEKSKYDSCLY